MSRSVCRSRPVAVRPGPSVRPPAAPSSKSSNRALYDQGRVYIARHAELVRLRKPKATFRVVAAEFGIDYHAVLKATTFAQAVDAVAANCGPAAKDLLLSDHPRLPAAVVMKISRVHADRQVFALKQAKAGRSALGKPPAGVDPPFDTHGYPEAIGRFPRMAGQLHRIANDLLALPPDQWPSDSALRAIGRNVREIRGACRAMVARMERAGGRSQVRQGSPPWASRKPPKSFRPSTAHGLVGCVAGKAKKNDRDLRRIERETPPTRAQADAVLAGAVAVRRAADRLAAVLRARWHDRRTGPAPVPGTYVVVYRLPAPAAGLTVGKLGTFDFPAGYYAYVGSAFGPGGVRGRTGRHLTPAGPKKWNVDFLKATTIPVEVWWTLDGAKVECHWAGLVERLAGAGCPAAEMGARDCGICPAHLWHFPARPSFAAFAAAVAADLPGHATVFRAKVTDWAGAGWPAADSTHAPDGPSPVPAGA